MQQLQAFATGHCGPVVRGDAFHLGPVCGFPVAGIAQHHAVCIQGVPVAFPPSVSGHAVSFPFAVTVAAGQRVAADGDGLARVIITSYHDNMIRTQVSFDEELFTRAKEVARARGISLSELCRRGVAELIAKERSDKPWMAYAGMFEGRPDDSSSVDEVVYGRERP